MVAPMSTLARLMQVSPSTLARLLLLTLVRMLLTLARLLLTLVRMPVRSLLTQALPPTRADDAG